MKLTLTPMDINNKEFKKVMRGYCPEEVDDFLDEVIENYEALYKENASLKEEKSKIELEKDLYKELAKCLLHEAIDLTDPDSLIPIEEFDLLHKTKKSGNLIELYEYFKANKKIR